MTAADRAKHFEEVVARLPGRLAELRAATSAPRRERTPIPEATGVYLFEEHSVPMYVGQARDLRRRLRQHTIPSSHSESATFAFILATEMAEGRGLDATGTRKERLSRAEFNSVFLEAKERVAAMPVSFILIDDPIERTVFEMYAALHLGTERYNSFETH